MLFLAIGTARRISSPILYCLQTFILIGLNPRVVRGRCDSPRTNKVGKGEVACGSYDCHVHIAGPNGTSWFRCFASSTAGRLASRCHL